MSKKAIKERIYILKTEIRILDEVLNQEVSGFGRPRGSLKYTDEQITFLKLNKNQKNTDLIKMFNEKFNTNYKSDSRSLYNFMERQGIIISIREVDI